jgi:hypothetical protein
MGGTFLKTLLQPWFATTSLVGAAVLLVGLGVVAA